MFARPCSSPLALLQIDRFLGKVSPSSTLAPAHPPSLSYSPSFPHRPSATRNSSTNPRSSRPRRKSHLPTRQQRRRNYARPRAALRDRAAFCRKPRARGSAKAVSLWAERWRVRSARRCVHGGNAQGGGRGREREGAYRLGHRNATTLLHYTAAQRSDAECNVGKCSHLARGALRDESKWRLCGPLSDHRALRLGQGHDDMVSGGSRAARNVPKATQSGGSRRMAMRLPREA